MYPIIGRVPPWHRPRAGGRGGGRGGSLPPKGPQGTQSTHPPPGRRARAGSGKAARLTGHDCGQRGGGQHRLALAAEDDAGAGGGAALAQEWRPALQQERERLGGHGVRLHAPLAAGGAPVRLMVCLGRGGEGGRGSAVLRAQSGEACPVLHLASAALLGCSGQADVGKGSGGAP